MWFKDMGFFLEDDQFDCNQFLTTIEKNIVLMRYIIQWIIGDYDPIEKEQENNKEKEKEDMKEKKN